MDNIRKFNFNVNGFDTKAAYFQRNIDEIFIPLLRKWTEMSKEKDERFVIFLVAPPAAGKTTLSIFLEYLSKNIEGIDEIQAIGLDGFHFHGDYIRRHSVNIKGKDVPMSEVKGCLETFDIDKLKGKLKELEKKNIMWPIYDRNIHDVVEASIFVNKKIILIEGNWLLTDEEKWRDLKDFCNYSIFINADEEILKQRLIDRKMKGGFTHEEALGFYEKSDSVNVRRVLNNHFEAELELIMKENGDYIKNYSRITIEKVLFNL
ncbi:nucleoside/nucleotide kinase family protein [Clostridium sp.]|uniref:nucleoside/nucleotide kinase family protein n=1 Tax=Clostridium sp. TaxID=1506 RepID=UPI00284501B5|nr:nucleoside/nucleotide kinase family protein [Clostridium sp.]MDR3597366.1 nucleoside/nucleotide kinase family protein [Clostridium sp.]